MKILAIMTLKAKDMSAISNTVFVSSTFVTVCDWPNKQQSSACISSKNLHYMLMHVFPKASDCFYVNQSRVSATLNRTERRAATGRLLFDPVMVSLTMTSVL
jgi:hypothetical protein